MDPDSIGTFDEALMDESGNFNDVMDSSVSFSDVMDRGVSVNDVMDRSSNGSFNEAFMDWGGSFSEAFMARRGSFNENFMAWLEPQPRKVIKANQKAYACPNCPSTFTRKSNLNRHQREQQHLGAGSTPHSTQHPVFNSGQEGTIPGPVPDLTCTQAPSTPAPNPPCLLSLEGTLDSASLPKPESLESPPPGVKSELAFSNMIPAAFHQSQVQGDSSKQTGIVLPTSKGPLTFPNSDPLPLEPMSPNPSAAMHEPSAISEMSP